MSQKQSVDKNFQWVNEVPVTLSVTLGKSEMTVAALMALESESIVALNTRTTDPIEISLNDRVIARGKLVVINDNYGIQITEILS